jgi:hypothetical protein
MMSSHSSSCGGAEAKGKFFRKSLMENILVTLITLF